MIAINCRFIQGGFHPRRPHPRNIETGFPGTFVFYFEYEVGLRGMNWHTHFAKILE